MNPKIKNKLLRIFSGGEAVNDTFELVDGVYVKRTLRRIKVDRTQEKEEMRRLKDEIREI